MKTISYERTRLNFCARLIEPLEWDDVIRIVTPHGTFELTKREFYDVFPHVVKTRSYQKIGMFNYRNPPEKAMRFLVAGSRKG